MTHIIDINYFQKIILILVCAFVLTLGFGVYLANIKIKTNRYYLTMSSSVILWLISSYMVYLPGYEQFATLFGRVNFSAVAISLTTIYLFIINFPSQKKKYSIMDFSLVFSGYSLTALSLFSPWLITQISAVDSSRYWLLGILQYPFYIYAILIAIICVFKLFRSYFMGTDKERKQIYYPLFGAILVAFFNLFFNIIWPFFRPMDNLFWIGDYSIIFFIALTAYSITKHQLFNIKIITTETSIIAVSIILFVQIFADNNLTQYIVGGTIWIAASFGGYQLVKSVKREIQQREEIQKLADKLEKANQELKDLDRLKDDFLSMASHELNTPLAAIEGYLSMILEENIGGKLSSKHRQYLSKVFISSKRLANLVNDLLSVSRIEQSRIHLILEQVDINDSIDQSIAEMKGMTEEKHQKIIFEKNKKIPKTWLDGDRIIEVITNLISNASKYSHHGDKIEISQSLKNNQIIVSVKDQGIGISSENQNRVFEKYDRGKLSYTKSSARGTGLGLFISKNLIDLHKGKIWLKSQENVGSTFYFSLPISKEKPHDEHEGEGAVLKLK